MFQSCKIPEHVDTSYTNIQKYGQIIKYLNFLLSDACCEHMCVNITIKSLLSKPTILYFTEAVEETFHFFDSFTILFFKQY